MKYYRFSSSIANHNLENVFQYAHLQLQTLCEMLRKLQSYSQCFCKKIASYYKRFSECRMLAVRYHWRYSTSNLTTFLIYQLHAVCLFAYTAVVLARHLSYRLDIKLAGKTKVMAAPCSSVASHLITTSFWWSRHLRPFDYNRLRRSYIVKHSFCKFTGRLVWGPVLHTRWPKNGSLDLASCRKIVSIWKNIPDPIPSLLLFILY